VVGEPPVPVVTGEPDVVLGASGRVVETATVDGTGVVGGTVAEVVVVAGSPHTWSIEKNGGGPPLPQRQPSTAPSFTVVAPTPTGEYE
jgi:hypothetical protein